MFVTDILEKYEHGDSKQKSHVLFDELKKLKARELKNKEIIFSTASREDLDKISNDTKPKYSSGFTLFEYENKKPIAFLDVNRVENNIFYCVIFVDEKHRGKQLGVKLYQRAINKLSNFWKLDNFMLVVSIEIHNDASIKTAEKVGFEFNGFDDEQTLLYSYKR